MSSIMTWAPLDDVRIISGVGLKGILRKRFDNLTDGVVVGYDELEYFKGLADGGVSGAQQIVDAITAHDKIRITE